MFSTIVLQNGPIQEVGVNGDQIDDIIRFAKEKLEEFNTGKHASLWNDDAIFFLDKALKALAKRTAERQARGVEGTSRP